MNGTDLLLAMVTTCAASVAQTMWSQQPVAPALPSPHAGAAVGYPGFPARPVLFGGVSAGVFSNATWTLSATGWIAATPTRSPSARAGARMDEYAMLFGGFDGQSSRNDTWRYGPTASGPDDWSEIRPSGALPPRRAFHAQAAVAEVLFVHGGVNEAIVLEDTWRLQWDGRWQQIPSGPSARAMHAMARMPHSTIPDVVLFGGRDASGVALDDTWVLRSAGWSRQSPSNRPPARFGHVLAADHLRGVLVLFGGTDGNGTAHQDVWEWGGTDWRRMPDAPAAAREAHVALYDAERQGVVVYGGLGRNDTWLYATAFPPRVSSFDAGCQTEGTLAQDYWAWTAGTWIGGQFRVSTNIPGGSLMPVFCIGGSRTSWAGGLLPFPLTSFGGAGCLLVRPDIVLVHGAWACGRQPPCCACSHLDLWVPSDPALAGISVFVQALDFPSGPTRRVLASNGLEYVLGWR